MPGGAGAAAVPLTDEDIIEGVRAGDDRIAAIFYDRLRGTVDGTLYRVLGRREADHEDLIQRTFEQVILTLSRHTFAHMCSLRTWASRVATNVALNALRARRRERAVIDRSRDPDLPGVSGLAGDPTRMLDSRSQLQRVRLLLSEMNPKQVEVLLLHDVLEHNLGEIAVMVGASVPAVQSRLFRGRKELRRRLQKAGLGELGSRP